MEQILQVASQAGLSKEQCEAATGGIMSFVKNMIGNEEYKKISDQIPEVDGLVAKHDEATRAGGDDQASGGGLLGQAMSMLGQADAGGTAGGLAGIFGMLQKQGINMNEVQKFMPQLAGVVKQQSGVDISKYLGLPESSTSGDASATGSSTQDAMPSAEDLKASVGNVMGSFFGK